MCQLGVLVENLVSFVCISFVHLVVKFPILIYGMRKRKIFRTINSLTNTPNWHIGTFSNLLIGS